MVVALIGMGIGFGLAWAIYPKFIEYLNNQGSKQEVSQYALDEFKNKAKTPTFGGLVFVGVASIVSLTLGLFSFSPLALLVIGSFAGFAIIGYIDDYKIVNEGKNDGLSPKAKMGGQLLLAALFFFVYKAVGGSTALTIPFVAQPLELGWFYLPFIMFLFAGSSNAVNLTDGMDGLAGGTSIIALIPFAYVAYTKGETAILIIVLVTIGTLLAYLVYNRKPAKIFMGDVGSLALGALFAALSVVLNKEILLAVAGGVFVIETLCVIIQRLSWKLRKKKIFPYTPIHYSFTMKGWDEADVVNLFYAVGVVFMVLAFVLVTLT